MKTFLLLLLLPVFISGLNMQPKKKIIFFGDSITELGIKSDGYITKLDSILAQKDQSNKYELIGSGISGDKIYDLYLRMDTSVLDKKPDAVVIFIGVNDVWHKRLLGTGTDLDKFEKFYTAIIKRLKQENIAVYLCTPAVIGEKNDFTNSLDGELNSYSAIVGKIAQTNNCVLIDLRQAFLDYLKTNNPGNKDRGILTTDGVHLNKAGNVFVAQQMYAALSKDFIK